jgi:hypothetical protein
MHTLVAFATGWGSKFGGINSFNTDFLSAFGVAYHHSAQVICIVASATAEEIEDARNTHVGLVPLPYAPQNRKTRCYPKNMHKQALMSFVASISFSTQSKRYGLGMTALVVQQRLQ